MPRVHFSREGSCGAGARVPPEILETRASSKSLTGLRSPFVVSKNLLSMRPHPKTKRLSSPERRITLVTAFVTLAASDDPGAVTTEAIARKVGVSHAAVFRHFPTRDALVAAAIEWAATDLIERLDQAKRTARSTLAALEAMFLAHAEFATTHPGVPRILISELQKAGNRATKRAVRSLIAQYACRISALVEHGKAKGEITPKVDGAQAAVLVLGSIQGLALQSLMLGQADWVRRQAPGIIAVIKDGLRKK